MLKVDKLKSLFNCKFCSKLLDDPVILPCGTTVCKIHSEEVSKTESKLCSEMHSIPPKGFIANEVIQDMLKIQLNTL